VSHLQKAPDASLASVLEASREVRLEAYEWLFRTQRRRLQDRRIATLLEHEAFLDMHTDWQRLGYPFDHLVPSLATSIGSSADQPAALAELLGILANDGIRLPTIAVERLRFAADTPYETLLEHRPALGERVLAPEAAAVTREALRGVVREGTARRLGWTAPEWAPDLGGKTGTGDHRLERYDARGRLIDSRVMNRSAVFTFLLGDRYFGTVTAFVPGAAAGHYRFTSALPVQVLGLVLQALGTELAGASADSVGSVEAVSGDVFARPGLQSGA
jgi:hypothetical protein